MTPARTPAIAQAGSWSTSLVTLGITIGLALVYGAWRVALGHLAPLPPAAYGRSWLLWEALQQPLSWLFLLGSVALPTWQWHRLRWSAVAKMGPLRPFALFLGILLAWLYGSYGYNYYFDQLHLADRLLLPLLWTALLVHPVALGPLIWWTVVIQGQFNYPLGGYSVADIRPVYEQLLMLQIYLGAFVVVDWWGARGQPVERLAEALPPFWALALILQAANYLGPGWGKLTLNWVMHNDLANLWLAAYQHGWQGSLSSELLADLIARLNTPLLIFTLLVELSMLFVLWRRRLTLLLLLAAIALHLGILALSGIFFWKWVLVNIALLLVVWRLTPAQQQRLYRRPILLAALVTLLGSGLYFRPSQLYWYDTPLNQIFQLEVITITGERQPLDRNFMRPYQLIFSKEGLHFLHEEPEYVGSYGATLDQNLLAELAAARLNDRSPDLAPFGSVALSEAGQRRFDALIGAYFRSYNERRRFGGWRYPDHIQSAAPAGAYDGGADVAAVEVRYLLTYFNGESIEVWRDEIIWRVEIPDDD